MAKKPHDDLFEGTSMSFGEHLEELRVCLFRGIVGIAIGCIIGFLAADHIVRFFQGPLERAMERHYVDRALGDMAEKFGGTAPYEMKRMILDEKVIPDPMLIDAGELAQTLKLTYPERFGGFDLSPYWITEGDLLDGGAKAIAVQLASAGKGGGAAPEKRLWELMSDDERKTIESLSETASLSRAHVAQLLAVLNGLAGKKELHSSSEFKSRVGWDVDTTRALREQLAKESDPEVSRRLNKLLLTPLFPDAMRKARVNLLSLYAWKPVNIKFQVLNAQEAFMIWLKAALTAGLVLASPWVLYQIWIFVAAGLYPHEKNYVYLYLPISILLFFGGAALAFAFVFDPVLDFLFRFNKGMNAEFEPRIGEWLGFVLILPLGFGVSFQLPLVMLFVNRLGLVTIETFVNQWRIAILTIFVVAMVLTPADPISMLLMAGPLCALYVLGILMCKYMPRGRNPFAEAYEP